MKFNLRSIVLAFCALTSLAAQSQSYPPYPTPGTSAIYYGIYPVNIEVPYGANSTNPAVYQLTFYIVNQSSIPYKLSNFSMTPANPPGTNPVTVTGYSNNCGGVVPALVPNSGNNVCTIFANVKATNPTSSQLSPITYNFSFDYTAGVKATQPAPSFTFSFASGQPIASAARTFTFVNNCTDTDIYFGIDSGAAPAINPNTAIQPPDPQSCLVDSDCYPGSSCVTVASGLKHCFWANPAPTNTNYLLNKTSGPAPHSNTVSFPVYDNGISIAWNGGIAARVGCDGTDSSKCKIADCGFDPTTGDNNGACPVPGGFATPSSLAEFSLLGQNPTITSTSGTPSVDTYDITIINGVTVPISMAPTTVAWGGASQPYTCANPGARTTVGAPLGDCPWFDILPPADNAYSNQADFIWVDTTGSGLSCPTNSCTGSDVCGHTVSGATVSAGTVCGPQLGYLTADAVCAIDADFGAPFNCSIGVDGYLQSSIYGCSAGDYKHSCYSAGATDACCGCQNWDSYATVPPAPLTQSCGTVSNADWQASLITTEFLPWLKQACPTAYIYPFDDASSTFTCSDVDNNNNNVVDYTITFCPA